MALFATESSPIRSVIVLFSLSSLSVLYFVFCNHFARDFNLQLSLQQVTTGMQGFVHNQVKESKPL